MIDVKELMIGSYVLYKNEIKQVKGIDSDSRVSVDYDGCINWVYVDKIEPIELTEQILSDFGFKKTEINTYENKQKDISSFYLFNTLKYLHKLQMYFRVCYEIELTNEIKIFDNAIIYVNKNVTGLVGESYYKLQETFGGSWNIYRLGYKQKGVHEFVIYDKLSTELTNNLFKEFM